LITPQACVSRSRNLTTRNQHKSKRFFSIDIYKHRQLI
jgi:hypothetical protein